MGKYEKLIEEDLSRLIKSSSNKIKGIDVGKTKKEEYQETIDILSESSCEINHSNPEKDKQEKSAKKRILPFAASTFFKIMPLKQNI